MSDELPAVLAVDAGNSKTDLALVAADGSLLASVRGPGMTGDASLDDKIGLLDRLVRTAQGQGGRQGHRVAEHICACVANADLPEEEEEFAGALRKQAWSTSVAVVNDTFAVLRAGFAPDDLRGENGPGGSTPAAGTTPPGDARRPGEPYWGVAVTCGAGINCVGVAPDGRTVRFLALGAISGDWGGGGGLGAAALWHAIRDEDGRGPQTALREAVAAHYGLPSVYDVVVGFHQDRIGYETLRDLAPVVLRLAAEGDDVAAAIARRQADEIVTMAMATMRRLHLTESATPVMLGGGLMTARNPVLLAPITAGIAAGAPHATVHVVTVPPIAGAALLGLDHISASPDIRRRLAAAYA